MITPSFSLTATERVLPKLALDFTTASLDPRVTFTRSGNTATVVNSSGYVATINADLPRFDYNPTTLTCKGLLIEEARTNLFTYSEDFGDASWVKSNATVSTNVAVSPSNVQNADKIVEAATNTTHFVEKVVSLTTGTAYTWSCFYKAGERSVLLMQVFTNVNHYGYFDVTAGTAGATGNATSTITNMGNGWYRCSVTFTSGATGNCFFDTYLSNGSTITYLGNGTSGLYAWGAQLEAGAFATSYIPTTSVAVTRNADVATMTGQGVAAQGTFTVDATVISGKTLITSGSVTFAATASTAQKTAVAYDVTSINKSINAATVTTGAGATASTTINIGPSSDGYFRKMAFYLPKLTNAELQAFSK